MNNMEIKKLLQTSQYDFLRTHPQLGNRICLLTLGGSHLYGTNRTEQECIKQGLPPSDVDIRGFAIERPENFYSLANKNNFDVFIDKPTDTSINSLKKELKLLTESSPSVIEILGASPDQIFFCNQIGAEILKNKDLFISKFAYKTFSGYATSQLRRLENALATASPSQLKKEQHLRDSLNALILTQEERFKLATGEDIRLYIDDSDQIDEEPDLYEDMNKELYIDLTLKHYPLRKFLQLTSSFSNTMRNFDKVNHRNRKKDEFHLRKHASHLVRLHLTLKDILEGKGICSKRVNDLPLLKSILTGAMSYEEVFAFVHDIEKDIDYAYKHSPLPEIVDLDKINELSTYLYETYLMHPEKLSSFKIK